MEEKNVYVVTVDCNSEFVEGVEIPDLMEGVPGNIKERCIAGIFDEEHKEDANIIAERVKSVMGHSDHVSIISVEINKDLMKSEEENGTAHIDNDSIRINSNDLLSMKAVGLAIWFESEDKDVKLTALED